MLKDEQAKREAIIAHCLEMNHTGLNQGTSGNISIRHEGGLLITPTSLPYEDMVPEDIVWLDADGTPHGPRKPSSEWRFHRDILNSRPDVNAVIHTHSIYCTIIAILGKPIPPLHYMVAVCGGSEIRCAPYAIFGSEELSRNAVAALEGRSACLLAHHGLIATGSSVEKAMWRAIEVETLAKQYHGCLALGAEPPLLDEDQIQAVLAKIDGYGRA